MDGMAHMLPGEDRGGKMQFHVGPQGGGSGHGHLPFELSEPWQAGFSSAARRGMRWPRLNARLNEGAV
jgi:hypothetical protein